jgi:hypothetical protein
MVTFGLLRRFTRAERVRVAFADPGGGLRLPLASRRVWVPGLGVGLAFLVMTSIAWQQSTAHRPPQFDTVIHGVVGVLGILWLMALWATALVLLGLAVVLLRYRESARLAEDRLIHAVRLGPAYVFMEYELTKIRELRAADVGQERAQLRFDYVTGEQALGSDMPAKEAAARVKVIQGAIDAMAVRRPSGAVPTRTSGRAEPSGR